MMKMVNIELPEALIPLFIEMAKMISQDMGNAGCNDFIMKNTPENREIIECSQARWAGMTLEEYRESDEYCEPQIYKGDKLCGHDQAIFGLFVNYFKVKNE